MQVGVGKNCVFDQSGSLQLRRLISYHRKFVSILHGGPHPRQCAGRGICGVINNTGGSWN